MVVIYSEPVELLKVNEETASLLVGHVELAIFGLGALLTSTLLGIKVVLAWFACDNLATFGDLEALRIRFVGLHGHKG
jgi:hypothetical protein